LKSSLHIEIFIFEMCTQQVFRMIESKVVNIK
jgi:hypothetical protein